LGQGDAISLSEFRNYFNYFTEIEEHFQKARGTSLFLLSPLDWALIETWKNSGIPLEAALRGIDAAFEKWHGRRHKGQQVNSLAFCSQAVMIEAQRTPESSEPGEPGPDPFDPAEIAAYMRSNLADLEKAEDFSPIAAELARLIEQPGRDLEQLEQKLTVLEQRMIALAQARQSNESALENRREMENQLQPYRRKMSAPQLAMLERQFLERKLLEQSRLPRLSLFYLR
jgi:hypothetical protein